jgi:hypothetical protein
MGKYGEDTSESTYASPRNGNVSRQGDACNPDARDDRSEDEDD